MVTQQVSSERLVVPQMHVSSLPSQMKAPYSHDFPIGVDLTALGAHRPEWEIVEDDEGFFEFMNYPKLASAAYAAFRGGIDFVTLGSEFTLRSDEKIPSMDSVSAAQRLHTIADIDVHAGLPVQADAVAAVDHQITEVPGSLHIEFDMSDEDPDVLSSALVAAHTASVSVRVRAQEIEHRTDLVSLIVEHADEVHLVGTWEDIKLAADAIRRAAQVVERVVCIFAVCSIIVSGERGAARERENMLSLMMNQPLFTDEWAVIGTVYDVVDEVQRSMRSSLIDGLVFIPEALPTDLASLIRGVLPLVRDDSRGGE
ncbi:MAG: hypothetical protein SPI12_05525 [Actinomycetaceae bacterium]|nr:hypothetical protein [Actinomycetaceae bacterium]MDY6083300.1 hypothetical protein [Actinomycetaceae bacterium]